jgi:hypothetical protein
MNERIRQLADEALQLVADERTDGDKSRLNTDSYHVKDLIQSKFAELIVRECASVLLKWKDEPFPFDEDLAASLIKEHFGVEE